MTDSGYQLVQLANGTYSVRSTMDAETFHPVAGPEAEAKALYVEQLRLRERLEEWPEEFVIWDVGLGAAANPVTALRCTADIPTAVRIVSFDRTTQALEFALRHAEQLAYLQGFETALRQLAATGTATIEGPRSITWELRVGDFPSLMAVESTRFPTPHAIFYDAFSPARNPEMWMVSTLSHVFRHASPNRPCSLATFSRSTSARCALLLAGFWVGRGTAVAGKEETTIAANVPELLEHKLDAAWLERARRSHAAEPLREPAHTQRPLSIATLHALQTHPQFRG